jgi:hypothetical protein
MTEEIERLKAEVRELQDTLSAGVSFIEAMRLTSRLKKLERQIEIATAGEPPESNNSPRRAVEMRRPEGDVSSPHGSGHDPLTYLFGK